MAEVLLFHHAQGLTPGVVAFADELRRAGHTVHTPDLFEGRTFATLEEGVAHAEEIGFGEVVERGVRAVDGLSAEVVYAGFSLGVLPAQKLAQTRAGARGALLFDACVPVSEFGATWPGGVPVQVHAMDADPFFVDEGDLDAARALVAEADDAELFLYPGGRHLFADRSLPSYDADAAGLLTERVLGFLAGVTEPGAGAASPVAPSMHSRIRSAWPLCRAYSSIMWTTIQRRLGDSPFGQGRRAKRSRPPSASASVTRERERATAACQIAWSCSGVFSAAESKCQSQSGSAGQSTVSNGGCQSRPWRRWENQ